MPSTSAPRTTTAAPSSRRPALAEVGPAPASALAFSESVRLAVGVAHQLGLTPPVFRSPPGLAGVDRSIRRSRRGSMVVAIRRAGRPLAAVQSDIIDGLVVANGLSGADADRVRRAVWNEMHLDAAQSPSAGRREASRPSRRSRRAAEAADAVAGQPESRHAA